MPVNTTAFHFKCQPFSPESFNSEDRPLSFLFSESPLSPLPSFPSVPPFTQRPSDDASGSLDLPGESGLREAEELRWNVGMDDREGDLDVCRLVVVLLLLDGMSPLFVSIGGWCPFSLALFPLYIIKEMLMTVQIFPKTDYDYFYGERLGKSCKSPISDETPPPPPQPLPPPHTHIPTSRNQAGSIRCKSRGIVQEETNTESVNINIQKTPTVFTDESKAKSGSSSHCSRSTMEGCSC